MSTFRYRHFMAKFATTSMPGPSLRKWSIKRCHRNPTENRMWGFIKGYHYFDPNLHDNIYVILRSGSIVRVK